MERKLKSARNLINKIVKNIGRQDIDYTVQVSINSTRPDRVNYCAQIEAPANGLQPITFVKSSYDELIEALTKAEKNLDQKAVEKAYYASEIQRAEEKRKFFEEKLLELSEDS